ncbi:MAG TPA: hypothetical protein VEF91_01250 [Verrucomicrobiae bacterium]|nr:hypothetical protein [Verrucomicrobiae bacterium]
MVYFDAIQKIVGTNCYNCMYISQKDEPVDPANLNDEGGIDPKTSQEMERAKKAGLITLPGGVKSDTANTRLCYNANIKMYVTARMYCGFWTKQRRKETLGKKMNN